MTLRLYRAWRFYIGLNYSWHLAWHKSAYRQPLHCAPRRVYPPVRVTFPREVL